MRDKLTQLMMFSNIEIRELERAIRRAWPIANDLGLPLARLQLQRAMLEAELQMLEEGQP